MFQNITQIVKNKLFFEVFQTEKNRKLIPKDKMALSCSK